MLPVSFMLSANTANDDYKIDLYTAKDGFSTFEIYSIIQDKKGFIWFGTGSIGLFRYDGINVDLRFQDLVNPGNLMLDKDGDVWIGTWGAGASVLDLENNQLVSFQHDANAIDSLSDNRIQTLFQDSDDVIWLGSYANGINKYIADTDKFIHFNKRSNQLSHDRVWDIVEANEDQLWVGTSYGLNLLSKTTGEFSYFLPSPENKTPTNWNTIRHIVKTSTDEMYIGTDKGLLVFNSRTNKFNQIKNTLNQNIGKVYSLIKGQDNIYWAGTSKGLFRFNPTNEIAEEIILPHKSSIRIVFEDRTGIIWATSDEHGVYKLVKHKKFHEIKHRLFKSPNSLYKDINGDIIVATADASLLKVNSDDYTIEVLKDKIIPDNILITAVDKTYAPILHQTSQNEILFAQQHNIIKYNLKTKTSLNLKDNLPHYNTEMLSLFRTLNSDELNNIWIGTYRNGLHVYNEKTQNIKHFMPDRNNKHSLSHAEVLIIYRDNMSRMWVGTGEGLNLWDEDIQGFHQFIDDNNNPNSISGFMIQSIHQDSQDRIWVGTRLGLNLYDEKTNSFKLYSKKSGLDSNWIKGILDDDLGHLWMSTPKGISKINHESNEISNYDMDDGLLGVNYYKGALLKDKKGTIFLSGPRGIDYFNPNQINIDDNHLSVELISFSKMGEIVELDKSYPYVKNIKLSYQDSYFSFDFIALGFESPEKIKYSYKLEGFDENWIDNRYDHTASYTNLSGGSYVFKVKATNNDSNWSEQYLSINIIITSPPWKTWWAYSLYLITFLLSVFLYIRITTHKQQAEIIRQKTFVTELQLQVKQKTETLLIEKNKLSVTNVELEKLTFQDGLTRLYNRRYFDRTLMTEISRHQREQAPLSLIMCDIDHFKLYNDTYGHLEGDNCIINIANILSKNISRSNDCVCRYGGEEFAIILTNTTSEDAKVMVDNLLEKINNFNILHETSETAKIVTLSFGVYSLIPLRATTPESLIKEADTALYQSKNNGRNQATFLI